MITVGMLFFAVILAIIFLLMSNIFGLRETVFILFAVVLTSAIINWVTTNFYMVII